MENNDTLTVVGTADVGSTVTVTFPDGSTTTVTTDTNGNYSATSSTPQNLSGDIKIISTDKSGNVSNETTQYFGRWYTTQEDNNATQFVYGDPVNPAPNSTAVAIEQPLNIEKDETTTGEIALNISPNATAPAPTVIPDAPNGCDTQSYKAYARLYKGDGSVETGYRYSDSGCGDISDGTLFDGGRLRFVPGTKVRFKPASADKGGMVIIIDAQLKEATKFGER